MTTQRSVHRFKHRSLYLSHLIMALLIGDHLVGHYPVGGGLSSTDTVGVILTYIGALLLLWGFSGNNELSQRGRRVLIVLDNLLLLLTIPSDPNAALPLFFLLGLNPLECSLRYDDDRTLRDAMAGAALTAAGVLLWRWSLIAPGLQTAALFTTTITLFLFGYALLMIHDRKLTENDLVWTNERLLRATAATGIGLYSEDFVNGTRDWDMQTRHLLGVSQDFTGGFEQILPRVHREDRQRLLDNLMALGTTGSDASIEYRLTMPDGSLRWISSRTAVYKDSNDRVIQAIGTLWDDTPERQAQVDLEIALSKINSATRVAGIGYLYLDAIADLIKGDSSCRAIVGLPVTGHVDRAFTLKHMHENDRAQFQAALTKTLVTGADFDSRFRWSRPDNGALVHIRTCGSVRRDAESDLIVGVDAVCIDETELQLQRNQLAQFKDLLLAANRATLSVPLRFNPLDNSGEFYGDGSVLVGLPSAPPHSVHETFQKYVDKRDLPLLLAVIDAAAHPGGRLNHRYRMTRPLTPGGRWFEISAQATTDQAGDFTGFLGVARDVTRAVHARAEIEALRERFDRAVGAAGIGTWTIDMRNNRVYIDARYLALMGLAPVEFDSSIAGFLNYVHADDREHVDTTFLGLIPADGPREIRFRRIWPDGAVHWLQTRGEATAAVDGETSEISGSAWDVTREVELTQALERSNAELDDFAHIASHDLREPLRGLHNYAKFLQQDYTEVMDQEGRNMLSALGRLTQRLERLIADLASYSRIGRSELAMKSTDLNAVLSEVLSDLEFFLADHNVEIRVPVALPTLPCDGLRIGEVLRNLITNAVKYNDKMDKWVEIGYQSTGCIHYVRDNGIGIASEHHDRVFNIFRRLHARDAYGGGTGAGLTLAKRIIERHGGRIWLESEPGLGTAFYFTLGPSLQ